MTTNQNGKPAHVALVTGASSGIGEAMCRLLAAEGYELVVTARRVDRLEALKRELAGIVPVHIVALDLGESDAPQRLFDAVSALGLHVDTLINNAGYALPGKFLDTNWDDQARLIQVLATAPAHLIHLFAPAMVARGYGRVLNVASIGAFTPASPQVTLYSALKHFVMVTTLSLRVELAGTGVSLTTLCPGPTATEWAERANMKGIFARLPRGMVLSAEKVARLGFDAMQRGDARIVTGATTKLTAALLPFLPDSWAIKLLEQGAPD